MFYYILFKLTPKISWLWVLKYVLHFFVVHDGKLNIFKFWAVTQKKPGELKLIFYIQNI